MTIRTTKLGNGVTVATDHMPHVETASLGIWVHAGARSEAEHEHGIAHLLEHMAFKGTRRRSARDIVNEIESVGGDINAATSMESTAYHARVLKEDVPLAVDILVDILAESVLDPDELKREQHVIAQEIGASIDTPDDHVFDLLQEAAFAGQPLGHSILGTVASVTGFGRDDVSAYLGRNYTAPEMILAASGAVDHDMLVAEAEESLHSFAGGPGAAVPASSYIGGERRSDRKLEQINLVLGLEGVALNHDDVYVAQVLAGALGGGMSSRLFQEVREARGLCYSVYAFHWAFEDTGLFAISAATEESDIAELITVLTAETVRAAADFSEAEIASVKAQMKAGLLMSQESSSARAERLARQILVFGRPIPAEETVARIEAVTLEDVRRLAGATLSGSVPSLAAVGPTRTLEGLDRIAERLGARKPA